MRYALVVGLLVIVGPLGGCAALFGPKADPKLAAELSKLAYPKDAPLGPDLDVLVVRTGGALELVNRTPSTYRNMQVWLNQQYVARIDAVQIGSPEGLGAAASRNRLDLARFINLHGEPFPTGGLLAPEKSFPVVLAELFDPATGKRHRLLVVAG
jgi:hypothetical protein